MSRRISEEVLSAVENWVTGELLRGNTVTLLDLLEEFEVDPKTARELLSRFEARKSSVSSLRPSRSFEPHLNRVDEDHVDDLEFAMEAQNVAAANAKMKKYGAKTWFQVERQILVDALRGACVQNLGVFLPDELCKTIVMMAIIVPGFYQFSGNVFQPTGQETDVLVESSNIMNAMEDGVYYPADEIYSGPPPEKTAVLLWLDERGHISGHRDVFTPNRRGVLQPTQRWRLVHGAWSLRGELSLEFETYIDTDHFTGYCWYDNVTGTWANGTMTGGHFIWLTSNAQSFYLHHHFENVSTFMWSYHTNRPISTRGSLVSPSYSGYSGHSSRVLSPSDRNSISSPRQPLVLRSQGSRHSFLIQSIGNERKPVFYVDESEMDERAHGSGRSSLVISVDDMSLMSVNANTLVESRHSAQHSLFVAAANFIPENHPARVLIQGIITLFENPSIEIGVKFLQNRIIEVFDLDEEEQIGEGTWDINGRCFFDAMYDEKYVQFVGCSDGFTIIGELTVSVETIQNDAGRVINPGGFDQYVISAPVPR